MIKKVILQLICFFCITFVFAWFAEAENIVVKMGALRFHFSKVTGQLKVVAESLSPEEIVPKNPWEAVKVSSTIYHLRPRGVPDTFLKLNPVTHAAYLVTNGKFGAQGGNEKLIEHAIYWLPPPYLPPKPEEIKVILGTADLTYDTDTKEVALSCEGIRFLDKSDIELVSPGEGIYHFRFRGQQDPKVITDKFWQIDLFRRKLTGVTGRFGEPGGRSVPIKATVAVGNGKSAAQEPAVHEDLGLQDFQGSVVESAWLAKEAALFHGILSKQQFDILVVPVQVQDHAFDQIERSLMTQQLVRGISTATNQRVADPQIVERALGQENRTFPIHRIYKLANLLKVKTVVRAYAGHNRDMKMRFSVVVQEAPKGGAFDNRVKEREFVFKDIPFSDERLPSDQLAEMLPKLLADLGFKGKKPIAAENSTGLSAIKFPGTPQVLIRSTDRSPLVSAAHLAILGAFCPADARAGQEFFIRSLAHLQPVSTPDAKFLKAFALANLYRRPAALEVLKNVVTPEALALRSYLDGDLSALSPQVELVRNPIPRVLMLTLLNDVRWAYDYQTAGTLVQKNLAEMPPGWQLFGKLILTQHDSWSIPDAVELKKYLDSIAPVNGYSLKDIGRGMVVKGELSADDAAKIDYSVWEHRDRILKKQPWSGSDTLTKALADLDLLDLASEWAEQAMLKKVGIPVDNQGLYEEGIGLINRYETFFRGHPALTAYKVKALQRLARQKHDAEQENLVRTSAELARNACVWYGGQYPLSSAICPRDLSLFDADFPRRPFWHILDGAATFGDRKYYKLQDIVITSAKFVSPNIPIYANVPIGRLQIQELDLLYTVSYFPRLQRYHETLMASNLEPEANMLIDKYKDRFKGNPGRVGFLVQYFKRKGDDKKIEPLCEEAMSLIPGVWTPYYELGKYQLNRNSATLAKETFEKYPLFIASEKQALPESVNTVSLSNEAYHAGNLLHWTGATREARSLFERSAGYQTGSASGMFSEYRLAMYDRNYSRAFEAALAVVRRYPSEYAHGNLLRLMSVVWNAPETESLFFSLNMMDSTPDIWGPIITSQRMAGKSDDAVRLWLTQNGRQIINREQAVNYYLKAFLVDRKPDPELPDRIENVERYVPGIDQEQNRFVMKNGARVANPSLPAMFVASRNALMNKQYAKSFAIFEQWMEAPYIVFRGEGRTMLPMMAWSGTKIGRKDRVDQVLQWYLGKQERDFEYWLAIAMTQAAGHDHGSALKSLDLARANAGSSLSDTRFEPAWYQLIEVCELLLEDSGKTAYRDKVLEYAKMYQQMDPLESWTYAVEAKYAKTEEDRRRPLAMALYLDPRSEHIGPISVKEKEKARAWFKKNNPFSTLGSLPKSQEFGQLPL